MKHIVRFRSGEKHKPNTMCNYLLVRVHMHSICVVNPQRGLNITHYKHSSTSIMTGIAASLAACRMCPYSTLPPLGALIRV